MSEFLSKCPHCKSDLQMQDEWRGKKVQCPNCSTQFTVPLKSNPLPKTPPPPRTFPNRTNLLHAVVNSVTYKEVPDFEEDNFVLDSIETLKLVCFILFIFGCIVPVLAAIFYILHGCYMFVKEDWEIQYIGGGLLYALCCLLLLIPVYINFWISKLILCWFRGVYRNLIPRERIK